MPCFDRTSTGHILPQLGGLSAFERLDLSVNKLDGESRGLDSGFSLLVYTCHL